jgi:hypothetical protein
LQEVPPEQEKEAANVFKRFEALVREIAAEQPDAEMVELYATSFERAAQKLATTKPAVTTLASQIAAHIATFVH